MVKANFLTVGQAVSQSRLSEAYIRRMCRQNRIKSTQVGRTWIFTQSALDTFLKVFRKRGRPRKVVLPSEKVLVQRENKIVLPAEPFSVKNVLPAEQYKKQVRKVVAGFVDEDQGGYE